MYWTYTSHMLVIYWTYTSHMLVIYWPNTSHILVIYWYILHCPVFFYLIKHHNTETWEKAPTKHCASFCSSSTFEIEKYVFCRGRQQDVGCGRIAVLHSAVRQRAWLLPAPSSAQQLLFLRGGRPQFGAWVSSAPTVGYPRRRRCANLRAGKLPILLYI
jgi:hypothetical protein